MSWSGQGASCCRERRLKGEKLRYGMIFTISPVLGVIGCGMFSGRCDQGALQHACDRVIGWTIAIEMYGGWQDMAVWNKLILQGSCSLSGCMPLSRRVWQCRGWSGENSGTGRDPVG